MKANQLLLGISLLVCGWNLFIPVSWSGPDHDAAMAIIHVGEAISDTGKLDDAMAKYAEVEELFPQEYEAIAWARYRTSECLAAGWRWPEALSTMRWVWDRIEDGTITNAEVRFWGAFQFARCVDHGGEKWFLAQIAAKTLEIYDAIPEPGAGMDEAAGWLHYWRARNFAQKEQYDWSWNAAEQAWEIANKTKNGTLAAWSRLVMGDSARGQGNLILAHEILEECDTGYAPHEDAVYRDYLQISKTETGLKLGLTEDVRDEIMRMLEDQVGPPDLRMKAVQTYAYDAIQRGATLEAILPLAVLRSSLLHVPVWGPKIEDQWQGFRRMIGEDRFMEALGALASEGDDSAIGRAAARIQLADEFISRGLGQDALQICSDVEGSCDDPRFTTTMRLLEAEAVSSVDPQARRNAVEQILHEDAKDPDMAAYLLGIARADLWEATPPDLTYGEWLHAQQSALPENTYRIEKAAWLRDQMKDYESALVLLDAVLASGDPSHRADASTEKIANLYLLGRDVEAEIAVEKFIETTPDRGTRDHALLLAAGKLWPTDAMEFYLPQATPGEVTPEVVLLEPNEDAQSMLWELLAGCSSTQEVTAAVSEIPSVFLRASNRDGALALLRRITSTGDSSQDVPDEEIHAEVIDRMFRLHAYFEAEREALNLIARNPEARQGLQRTLDFVDSLR
jgi:tetratricopeptide (TPR) repeat protein